MRTAVRPSFSVLSLGFLFIAACATVKRSAEGDALFEKGNFTGALKSYQEAAANSPDDEKIKEKLKVAQIFVFLDEGRTLVFEGDNYGAWQRFKAVLVLDPENKTAKMWIDKTRNKVVKNHIQQGLDWLAEENYEQATESFNQALLLHEKNEDALAGLSRIRMVLDRELNKSQNYYLRAVRDRAANLLYQADANFDKSHLYNPSDPEVMERGKEVKHQLAEQRFLDAKKRENERHYGAALLGYRSIRSIDPDYPELAERIAAVELEIRAEELFTRGKNFLSRGDFDLAKKTFEEGKSLTKVERTQHDFDEKMKEVVTRELAALYLSGNALEQSGRLEEALAKYEEILKKADYYQDSIARRDAVKQTVQKATELYEAASKAEAEGNKEDALKLYEQIHSIYPRFRDVREKIDRLKSSS